MKGQASSPVRFRGVEPVHEPSGLLLENFALRGQEGIHVAPGVLVKKVVVEVRVVYLPAGVFICVG